jgi:hypothetical protein
MVLTGCKTVRVALNLSLARHLRRYILFVFKWIANCNNVSGWWCWPNNLCTCTNMRCIYLYIIVIYTNVTFLSRTATQTFWKIPIVIKKCTLVMGKRTANVKTLVKYCEIKDRGPVWGSCSGSCNRLPELLGPEHGTTRFGRNVNNHSPSDSESHPWRLESSQNRSENLKYFTAAGSVL